MKSFSIFFIFLFGVVPSFSQETDIKAINDFTFFSLEGNIGVLLDGNKESTVEGGFGLINYISLDEFDGGKRNTLLGISIPMRFQLHDVEENDIRTTNEVISISALLKLMVQAHPVSTKTWLTFAGGPEVRYMLSEDKKQIPAYYFQNEVGLRIYNPEGIFKDTQIGMTSGLPVGRHTNPLTIVNFFIRYNLF